MQRQRQGGRLDLRNQLPRLQKTMTPFLTLYVVQCYSGQKQSLSTFIRCTVSWTLLQFAFAAAAWGVLVSFSVCFSASVTKKHLQLQYTFIERPSGGLMQPSKLADSSGNPPLTRIKYLYFTKEKKSCLKKSIKHMRKWARDVIQQFE